MADYKLSYTGEQVDDALGKAIKAVSTDPQTLSAEQKAQAIQNIGAAKIDDESVTSETAWSSQHIVDTLCPEFSVSGNPSVCYPVAGSKLGVAVSWGPTQEGSGEPSPSNIRPIMGKSSVSVSRQEDEFSLTLALPESICAGEVNLENSGWEKWKTITLDGDSLKFTAGETFWNLPRGSAPGIADYSMGSGNILCSHFFKKFGSNGRYSFIYTAKENMAEFFASADELNAYIAAQYAAGTPVQIAYKLTIPSSFTATGGTPISAISGANTFSTNADSLTITGRADPTYTINALTNRVAALETAAANR